MYTFRAITSEDIPRLHRWRNQPHISRWWDPPNPSYALAQEEYTAYIRGSVAAYIVSHDGEAMGYIQQWRVADFPDYIPYVSLDPLTVGIDVFIGPPKMLHRGHGPRLMRAFLGSHVFDDLDVPACIIDPLPDNHAAIRAYEKVGFAHVSTFVHADKAVYLMRLLRENFSANESSQ